MSDSNDDPMEVWLFPYLPLTERVVIGPWELIPREQLTTDDTTTVAMVGHARNVDALYRAPERQWSKVGAFLRPPDRLVGDVFRGDVRPLYQALVTAMLDSNPSRAQPGHEGDWNTGQRMCTPENALLRRHGFKADLHIGHEIGVMVVAVELGPVLGDVGVIKPPIEMHVPALPNRFDAFYAQALYDVLANVNDESPDLAGAINWLVVAWTNAELLDMPGRLLALRAGYDVLFGGSETKLIRGRLSKLLDEPGAARTLRTRRDHEKDRQDTLTDLEWWFQSFALLRNKLAHGGPGPPRELCFEDGVLHLWHAEFRLRQAIKRTVANVGHPDVLLDDFGRAGRRTQEMLDAARSGAADGGTSAT
jgi:hypothetical protein